MADEPTFAEQQVTGNTLSESDQIRKRITDYKAQITPNSLQVIEVMLQQQLSSGLLKPGDLDAMINYTLVRTLLKDKPHVIIGLDFKWDYSFSTDSKNSIPVPLDIRYSYGEPKKFMGRYLNTENPKKIPRKPNSHPNEDGHKMIADDIIRWFA